MKPFRLFKEDITGEYWITDTGEVIYADGDIGDQGHESIALEGIYGELADDFGVDFNGDPDQLMNDIIQSILEDADDHERQQFQAIADNDPQELIINRLMALGDRNAKAKVGCAFGRMDAREYAVKVWNWRRVVGHDIECRQLTPQDMKVIAHGLEEILDGEDQYDYLKDEIETDDLEFYISTWGGRQYDVTLGQLKAGSLADKTTIGPQAQALSQAANQQVKDMSIQGMHPAYYPKETNPYGRSINPLGDSKVPYGMTFSEWLRGN